MAGLNYPKISLKMRNPISKENKVYNIHISSQAWQLLSVDQKTGNKLDRYQTLEKIRSAILVSLNPGECVEDVAVKYNTTHSGACRRLIVAQYPFLEECWLPPQITDKRLQSIRNRSRNPRQVKVDKDALNLIHELYLRVNGHMDLQLRAFDYLKANGRNPAPPQGPIRHISQVSPEEQAIFAPTTNPAFAKPKATKPIEVKIVDSEDTDFAPFPAPKIDDFELDLSEASYED